MKNVNRVKMSAAGKSNSNHGTAGNSNSNHGTTPPVGSSSSLTDGDNDKDNSSIKKGSFLSNLHKRLTSRIPYKKFTAGNLSTQSSSISAPQSVPPWMPHNLEEDLNQLASRNLKDLYECLVCDNFSANSLEVLLDHLNKFRTSMSEEEMLTFVNYKYMCKACDYQTSWKFRFWWHRGTKDHLKLVEYANHVSERKTERSSADKNSVEVRCNACDQCFTSIEELKLHSVNSQHSIRTSLFNYMRNYDEENNPFQRMYECVLCEFICRDEFQMVQHARAYIHLKRENKYILSSSKDKESLVLLDEEGDFQFKKIFKALPLRLNAHEQDPDSSHGQALNTKYKYYLKDICSNVFQRNPEKFKKSLSSVIASIKRRSLPPCFKSRPLPAIPTSVTEERSIPRKISPTSTDKSPSSDDEYHFRLGPVLPNIPTSVAQQSSPTRDVSQVDSVASTTNCSASSSDVGKSYSGVFLTRSQLLKWTRKGQQPPFSYLILPDEHVLTGHVSPGDSTASTISRSTLSSKARKARKGQSTTRKLAQRKIASQARHRTIVEDIELEEGVPFDPSPVEDVGNIVEDVEL